MDLLIVGGAEVAQRGVPTLGFVEAIDVLRDRNSRGRTVIPEVPVDTLDLAAVARALTTRPRKTLGWRTPAEALDEALRSAH